MKGRNKKQLHIPPAGFAAAAEARDSWTWQEHQDRFKHKNKRDSDCIMPVHRPPSPKVAGRAMAAERLYESEKSYRKRLAKCYKTTWERESLRGFLLSEP